MSKIGLFYASSTGATKDVADLVIAELGEENIDIHNVDGCDAEAMKEYSSLIFGISTWGDGDLQDDWEEYMPNIEGTNFSGKTVAMFGLGDQEEYCDNYLDAMGTIYNKVIDNGANVIGFWPTDGYDHDESTATIENDFVGLAIDEDNQNELTQERVTQWVSQIKASL